MKVILPILAIVILSTAAWKLTQMQPQPKAKAVEKKIPFVEIIQAEKSRYAQLFSPTAQFSHEHRPL